MISRGRPSSVSRCASSPFALSCGLRIVRAAGKASRRRSGRGAASCPSRPRTSRRSTAGRSAAAAAAVGEHRQRDRLRPAVVEELVHRRADGAAGVEDVVDEEELPVVDVERNLARLHRLVEARLARSRRGGTRRRAGRAATSSPSSRCRRSATQAPPVWMPTMPGRGRDRWLEFFTSSAQRASASGSCIAVEVVLQDDLRRHRMRRAPDPGDARARSRAGAPRPRPTKAFVDERHRQTEAALELSREALHPGRQRVPLAVGCRAAGPRRTAPGATPPPASRWRRTAAGAPRASIAASGCATFDRVLTHRDAEETLAEVEAEHGAGATAHACPASSAGSASTPRAAPSPRAGAPRPGRRR